jgi:hypothetical protein
VSRKVVFSCDDCGRFWDTSSLAEDCAKTDQGSRNGEIFHDRYQELALEARFSYSANPAYGKDFIIALEQLVNQYNERYDAERVS